MSVQKAIAGHDRQVRYRMKNTRVTQRIIRSLYKQAPVPIYERWLTKWCGRYHRKPWYTGKRSWPHIVVASNQPLYQRAAVVLHEIGHHHCAETSCVCRHTTDHDHALNEAHAIMYGLCRCLDYGFIRSHRWSINHVLRLLDPNNYREKTHRRTTTGRYVTAAKHVTGLNEWDRHLQIATESQSIGHS